MVRKSIGTLSRNPFILTGAMFLAFASPAAAGRSRRG